MKHLNKYNENKEEVFEPGIDFEYLDIEYIKNCFIEFIDKGAMFECNYDDDDPRLDQFDVFIPEPDTPNTNISYFKSKRIFDDIIKSNINKAKVILDHWLDIENCIDKIKLKYPKLNFDVSQLTYSIKITITK